MNNVVHGSIETVGTRGRGEGVVVSAGMCVARVAMVVSVREATINFIRCVAFETESFAFDVILSITS